MTTVAILGHKEHGKTSVAQSLLNAGGGITVLDGRIDGSANAVVLVVSAPDGAMPGTRDAVIHAQGIGKLVIFINKSDMIGEGDDELIDLVELELRDLCTAHGKRDGDALAIIRGSAKRFLDGEPVKHGSKRTDGIRELMTAIY